MSAGRPRVLHEHLTEYHRGVAQDHEVDEQVKPHAGHDSVVSLTPGLTGYLSIRCFGSHYVHQFVPEPDCVCLMRKVTLVISNSPPSRNLTTAASLNDKTTPQDIGTIIVLKCVCKQVHSLFLHSLKPMGQQSDARDQVQISAISTLNEDPTLQGQLLYAVWQCL